MTLLLLFHPRGFAVAFIPERTAAPGPRAFVFPLGQAGLRLASGIIGSVLAAGLSGATAATGSRGRTLVHA